MENMNLNNFINSIRGNNFADAKAELTTTLEEKFTTYFDGIDDTTEGDK